MEPVRIFIDTNVILDYLTGRMDDGNAKTIVQVGRNPKYKLCISILTAVNVLYISRRYAPSLQPSDISGLFEILPMDFQQYCNAQTLETDDFEDALQVECASKNGCRVIVSRDRHLLDSGIQFPAILSPEEFLRQIHL